MVYLIPNKNAMAAEAYGLKDYRELLKIWNGSRQLRENKSVDRYLYICRQHASLSLPLVKQRRERCRVLKSSILNISSRSNINFFSHG